MKRNERKTAAVETVSIIKQGGYSLHGQEVDIKQLHQNCVEASELITPAVGDELVKQIVIPISERKAQVTIINETTLKVILDWNQQQKTQIGVLNFASAKNPGGGFLNGSLAQEESLAVASGLYDTQLHHEEYYAANRACLTMMYTDHMIYSPQVVFIRDDTMQLLSKPRMASILTAPAVNYGQVLLKKEDPVLALQRMKDRMRKVLAVFAAKGDRNLILGAYGCGVFRNDPETVARYWSELLIDEHYSSLFDHIVFAVWDRSNQQETIQAFRKILGRGVTVN